MGQRVDLDQLVDAIEIFKQQAEQASAAMKTARAEIIEQLESMGGTSVTTAKGRKLTIVRANRTTYDSDVLRDILGEKLWDEVTRRVLDTDKLESVVEREQISPKTLADALVEREAAPYVRITDPKKPRGRIA